MVTLIRVRRHRPLLKFCAIVNEPKFVYNGNGNFGGEVA